MEQSSSSVIAGIILIVGLAVAFALGIRYIGASVASTALPAPTATVQPTDVVGPTLVATAAPGKGAASPGSHGSVAPPTPTPPPPPTPTPATEVKVVMATGLGAGETALGAARTFPASLTRVYCVATFHKLGLPDSVTFKWKSVDTGALIWQSSPGDVTVPAAEATDVSKAVYFLGGPFGAGRYSCDVWLNGKQAGSAPFVMQ
jgi:hypothetical protein